MGADDGEETERKILKTPKDQKDIDKLQINEDLKNGPISDRGCTDIICCLLFIVFCLGMCGTSIYGWLEGDPRLLLIGWDGDGNGCGYSPKTVDYPFLYWPKYPGSELIDKVSKGQFEEAIQLLNFGACVKECPQKTGPVQCYPTNAMKGIVTTTAEDGTTTEVDKDEVSSELQFLQLADSMGGWVMDPPDSDNPTCEYSYFPIIDEAAETLGDETVFRYNTQVFANSFCLPGEDFKDIIDQETLNAFKDAFLESAVGAKTVQWAADIARAWKIFAIGAAGTFVLGYLYLFVIRCIGGIIIYFSLAIILIALGAAGGYSFYMRKEFTEGDQYYDYLTYGAYVLWGLCVLMCLILCCCWNAIKLGIAVFKATSQYVQENMHIFILPSFMIIIETIWFCFWVFSATFIFSIGTPQARASVGFLTEMKWDASTRYVFLYHLFGLFWCNAFIVGCTQFIIGASACIWYFNCNSDAKGKGTVSTAFKWCFRYHMGTIAFGSFIIAVCQMIRFLFEYYRRKIGAAAKTPPVKVMLCLTGYLLWLMEHCVKYITKNAYIQCALQNTHFFKSAWNAFTLMLKHAHRFGIGNSIGFIYMLFGAICMASIAGAGCYFACVGIESLGITEPVVPTIVMAIIASSIGYIFLSIFSFSSDAIFQSFLLDEELRFAGQNRPKYMQEFADEMKKRKTGCCCC